MLSLPQDGRGRLRKIEGWVAFPFLLDIGGFCEPSRGAARSVRYQLLGVVEHRGESLKCALPALTLSIASLPLACPIRLRSHSPCVDSYSCVSCRTGHYVAYVQRGTALPATVEAHLRQDAAPYHAADQTARQPSDGVKEALGDHPDAPANSAGSCDRMSENAQGPAEQTAQPGSSASAKGHSSHSSSEQPVPEALSWYLCTDEIVKPVSWDAVAKCKAYILLYMRIE